MVESIGNIRVYMPRPEGNDRRGGGSVDNAPRGGRPSCSVRKHAEIGRLEVGDAQIRGMDAQYDLLRCNAIAVLQRPHRCVASFGIALEGDCEQCFRLVDATENCIVAPTENLHHNLGVAPIGVKHLLGAQEVDVGILAGQHVRRWRRDRAQGTI
jgi:hypothetical protein